MSGQAPATGAGTATDPAATDPRLRGRTYAIPFDRVWHACVALAGGGLRGWSLTRADDQSGVLEAVSRTLVRKKRDLVVVDVSLDENAQTRVDLRCRREDIDGGVRRHADMIDGFCRSLDRKIGAGAAHILDARTSGRLDLEEPT